MTTETGLLTYGLSEAVPEGAKAAWGARFIVTQDGHVDLPPDRQGFSGDEEARASLMQRMNDDIPLGGLMALIAEDLRSGRLNTRSDDEVVLDGTNPGLMVVGNTKASAGYLYVAIFETAR